MCLCSGSLFLSSCFCVCILSVCVCPGIKYPTLVGFSILDQYGVMLLIFGFSDIFHHNLSINVFTTIMEQYGNNEQCMIMIIRDDHATKSDEFSGKFQTAFASPLIFEKLYCNFFRRRPKKALYKGPKSAK